MTLVERAVYFVAALLAVLIVGVVVAYWWANTAPRRPKGVALNAVFLWAPYVGLPAPRRGDWLACREDAARNFCRLSDVDGTFEYEGEFALYGGKGPLPAAQIKIDPEKSRQQKVWVGSALVPLVYMEGGDILIPKSNLEDGKRLLEKYNYNH